MAILGLTVGESGEALQRLSVATKVSIGEKVATRNSKGESVTRPSKLDHFAFLRKGGTKLEWESDPELTKHYGENCREVWIILLDDNIENVFRTELAWWKATEKKCSGDGRAAVRRTDSHPEGEDWLPCGKECPELKNKTCKPSGDLYFVLAEFPRLGSVCRIHTTAYRSVPQISSALEQIRTVTGGRLAGIRCKLTMRPERAVYFDKKENKKKTTTIYALNLELSAQDMQKLVRNMTQYARLFEQTRKLLGDGRKIVVEDEPEDERAADVAEEFYPIEDIVPAPTVQQPERASAEKKVALDGGKPEPVNAEIIWPKDGNGNGSEHHAVQFINAEQLKKFADIAVAHGYVPRQISEILQEFWHVNKSSEIPADKYDEVVRYFASDGQEKPKFVATDADIPF